MKILDFIKKIILKDKKMEDKYISKEVEDLKKQLDNLLFTKKEPIVISLQGYWGIGKTYFWHNYIKHKSQEDKHVYISLFGINSLDEIKRKIILKISDRAKISNKLKKFVGTSKIFGIDLSSSISLIEPNDFKNIIICFDDFERISPNLNISEILGFISELKEQYKCKIILINNNEILREQNILEHRKILKRNTVKTKKDIDFLIDLEEKELENLIYGYEKHKISEDNIQKSTEKYIITNNNNYEILSIFSEKIIDITLRYEPSIDDLVNLLKNNENSYINFDFILSLFMAIKDKNKKFNLRLMKQLITKIEVIQNILTNNEIAEHYKYGLIFNVFRLTVKENLKINEINFQKDIQSSTFSYRDELFDLIYRHKFNVEKVSELFKENSLKDKLNKEMEEHKQKVENLYFRYLYDLNYKDKDFTKEFFDLLQISNFDIIKIIPLSTLSWYIELLSKIDNKNKEKYNKFFLEKTKEYIKNNINSIEKLNNFLNQDFVRILDKYEELQKFYSNIKNSMQNTTISNKKEIIKLINDTYQKGGWNQNIENTLNNINENLHLEWLKNDQEYFKQTLDFVEWLQGFSGRTPFQEFYNKTIEIYKKLYNEDDYKNKIDLILKRFNINLNNKIYNNTLEDE